MEDKNCYVVRLNAVVDDPSLDPIIEDGTLTFHLYTNVVNNVTAVYTRPLGAFEMKVLGATPTLLIPTDTPESIEEGYIYKVTEPMELLYGGFSVEPATKIYVRVNMVDEEVQYLGYIYSTDVDLDLIGDVYYLQLSNPNVIPQKYHTGKHGTGIAIADLNLGEKTRLQSLKCEYVVADGGDGFVTGTTDEIAEAAVTGLGSLSELRLYGNKNFTGALSNLASLPSLNTLYVADCGTYGSIENLVRAIVINRGEDSGELYIGNSLGIGTEIDGEQFNVTWQGRSWYDVYWIKPEATYINVLNNGQPKKLSWTVSGNNITITITTSTGEALSSDSADVTSVVSLN